MNTIPVATTNTLPITGDAGEMYMNSDTGSVVVNDGLNWRHYKPMGMINDLVLQQNILSTNIPAPIGQAGVAYATDTNQYMINHDGAWYMFDVDSTQPFADLQSITTTNTESQIFSSSPAAYTLEFASDTNNLYLYDGAIWRVYNNDLHNIYSLSFDGTDDYMDCSSNFTSLWSGSFSISLWLKTPISFASGVDNYLGNNFVAGDGYIEFRHQYVSSSTARIEFYFGNSATGSSPYGTYGAATAAVLSTDRWYHLVLTADRPSSGTTTVTLYINGSPTTLTPHTAFLSTLPNAGGTWSNNTLIAARNNASSSLNLEGHLDEVAFFNSVLTSEDVSTIYNNGTPADLYDFDPTHWWRMGDNDGGTGTIITDQGSGGNDGTLIKGPAFSTTVPN